MFRSERYIYNIKIIKELLLLIFKYPDLRFFQILALSGIIEYSDEKIIDRFYEESSEIYVKLTNKT